MDKEFDSAFAHMIKAKEEYEAGEKALAKLGIEVIGFYIDFRGAHVQVYKGFDDIAKLYEDPIWAESALKENRIRKYIMHKEIEVFTIADKEGI